MFECGVRVIEYNIVDTKKLHKKAPLIL